MQPTLRDAQIDLLVPPRMRRGGTRFIDIACRRITAVSAVWLIFFAASLTVFFRRVSREVTDLLPHPPQLDGLPWTRLSTETFISASASSPTRICGVRWSGVLHNETMEYLRLGPASGLTELTDIDTAPCQRGSGGRSWRVRCTSSCSSPAAFAVCDWLGAWTERCDGGESYLSGSVGKAHARLAACLQGHFFITIGDCTVRSLLARALDAADGLHQPPTSAAVPLIALGHHLLLLRETAYGEAAHRIAYRYYPEPLAWNNWRRSLTLGEELSALLDVWRPAADFFGTPGRAVFLFGGTHHWLDRKRVDEVAAWLGGGCNASNSGCPWLPHVGMRNDIVAPRPLVIVKGPAPFPMNDPAWSAQVTEQAALAAHVRSLGFIWLDAWNLTVSMPWLARDHLHYDAYNLSHPAGTRAGGPLTLAITNELLDLACGNLLLP